MLKETLRSIVNAIWYGVTRRHLLEGRYDSKRRRYCNWDASYRVTPEQYLCPRDEAELAEVVRSAKRISLVGAGHTFNDIHLKGDTFLSLDHLAGYVATDEEAGTITFRGGTRMRDVNVFIEKLDLALPLLPDHNAQSIGGVLATDVHATGNPGYISQYVTALEVMDAEGRVHPAEKGSELFRATIGGMGCTGIIVKATFAAVPIFRLKTRSFTCSFEELVANLDTWYEEYDHFGAAYFPAADRCVVEAKKRSEDKPSWLGPQREDLKHIADAIAMAALLPITVRFGKLGKWVGGTILRVFIWLGDVLSTPLVMTSWEGFNRNVYHIHKEVEFACDPEGGRRVFRRAKEVFDREPNHSYYMIGVRRTRANENTMIGPGAGDPASELMWMAPHLVGTTTKARDEATWREIIEEVEGRPHNGKNMVGLPPAYVVARQPAWPDYLRVVQAMDPEHKFTNELVRETL